VLDALRKDGAAHGLSDLEQIRNVHIIGRPLAELGLVTGTDKLMRHRAVQQFKKEIDCMYKEGPLI